MAAVTLQLLFWWNTRELRPPNDVLDEPPGLLAVDIVSLSDRQAFFRLQTLELQNTGDLNGRITPLRDLDYERLVRWFALMDRLDARSGAIVSLAGFFYGQTGGKADVRRIAEYLRRHALADPERKWRFLAHAVYLARYRADDVPLALEIARDLAALPVAGLPVWTRQMHAFILADVGDREAARDIMEVILATDAGLGEEERTFIRLFIERRLRGDGDGP